ncbi:MAG: TolC family protein [Candidatus Cloacimonetes bacterium]|nr:TolC family protein [Candidatus Cloacimonadota bacterium]
MNHYVFTILLLFLQIVGHCATLGDKILLEREARLQRSAQNLGAFQEARSTSSLSGIQNINTNVILNEESSGIPNYTLLQAIKTALKQNTTLHNLAKNINISHKDAYLKNEVNKFHMDFKSGIHKTSDNSKGVIDDIHRRIANLNSDENQYFLGLEMKMPLLDGGKSRSSYNIAKLNTELSKIALEEYKQKLIRKVTQVFLEIILVQEKLEILGSQMEKHRQNLAFLEQNPTRDIRFPIEILQAKTKFEEHRHQEMTLRQDHQLLKNEFIFLLQLENPLFILDKNARTKVIREKLAGFQKVALTQSLDLKKLNIELMKKKLMDFKYKSTHMPKLDFVGKTSYQRLMDRSDLDEVTIQAGFDIDFSIFDGKRSVTKLRQNRERKKITKSKIDALQNRISIDVASKFEYFLNIKSQINVTKGHLQLAKQVLFEAEERYQNGQISKVKLLEVRIEYKKTIFQYYQILKDLILSKMDLFLISSQLNLSVFG